MFSQRFGVIEDTLRAIGSLWFAALILVLLVTAMACATVFESAYGSERALSVFYHAWWFEGLLALFAVNVFAAMVVRYPFSRRQIGFVVTHASLLLVLGGSLVTKYFGVDGRIGLGEGDRTEYFSAVGEATLTALNREDGARAVVDLDNRVVGGFRAADLEKSPVVRLGDLHLVADRYLPDSVPSESVVDDPVRGRPAVQVSLSRSGFDDPQWLFPDRVARLGPTQAAFRVFADDAQLHRVLMEEPSSDSRSEGTVVAKHNEESFSIPIETCMESPVPLGESELTLRVLRYIPHATVGADRKVVSASSSPENPAIEVELSGPAGVERRLAFAKFPDFRSMHGGAELSDWTITFVRPASTAVQAPVEVLGGPNGELYVRFTEQPDTLPSRPLEVGTPVPSPWPGLQFAVLTRFDHARVDQTLVTPDPIRTDRIPAIRAAIHMPDGIHRIWLQRGRPRLIRVADSRYEVSYGDRRIPLGFSVKLEDFRIGYYPGGRRPRSFESRIAITDAATGRTQSRLISMNHPVKYGGYSLYQSSYRLDGDSAVSFLSVSRDPGQPIVFAGYIGTFAGMLIVLGTRMRDRRRTESSFSASAGRSAGSNGRERRISLFEAGSRCQTHGSGSPRIDPATPDLVRTKR